MLDWMRKRPSTNRSKPLPSETREKQRGGAMPGKYLALYDYLDRRYASTVVLTVNEIEDILGFTLPDAARLDHRWWADPEQDSAPPSYQDAWRLAGRVATPNLAAHSVAFERPD